MKLTRLTLPLHDGGSSPRTPGIHLSGILGALAVAQGYYSPWPSTPTDAERDARRMKRIQGLAWEDWLAPKITRHYPTFEYHLGEMELDGIICTVDGISYESDGTILLHEIKHTKYSSKQLDFPNEKLTPWIWQCLGYLRVLTEHTGQRCTTAILHPLFADGDYKEHRWPQYLPVRIDFTWEEITAMWEVVLASKHLARPEMGNENGDSE